MTPADSREPMSDARRRARERQVQRQRLDRDLKRIPITIPVRDYLVDEDTDEWTE